MPKKALAALTWLILCGVIHAQAVLAPPFELKWGESPEHFLDWGDRAKLDITVSMPADRPGIQSFRVESQHGKIPKSDATAVEGLFLNGRLIEVTVHYADPGQKADTIKARFHETKRELTTRHGKFVANKQERSTRDQFSTRKLSYHREPVRGLFVLIAYTEVEDLLRKSARATYSVIYRNDNLRQRIERAAGGGETGSE